MPEYPKRFMSFHKELEKYLTENPVECTKCVSRKIKYVHLPNAGKGTCRECNNTLEKYSEGNCPFRINEQHCPFCNVHYFCPKCIQSKRIQCNEFMHCVVVNNDIYRETVNTDILKEILTTRDTLLDGRLFAFCRKQGLFTDLKKIPENNQELCDCIFEQLGSHQ